MQSKIERAKHLHEVIRQKTKDQVTAIITIGNSLMEMYNSELWSLLGYRSWDEYCGRAADLSVLQADRYIDVAVTFGDLKLPDHEYVGITKLLMLRRIAVSKTVIRKGLRMAKEKSCEEFKEWVAREGRKMKKKGIVVRPPSTRVTQVNVIFEPEEKMEFRQILEYAKEAMSVEVNGKAVLAMARFWRTNHRRLKVAV